MTTQQPDWKFSINLGDVHPLDHGGYFLYTDATGVYEAEGEWIDAPESDEGGTWTVYRFPLDRCKQVHTDLNTVYLVPAAYQADWARPIAEYDEWFHKDLKKVATEQGQTLASLRTAFCHLDPRVRAQAYGAIGQYHGFENLDPYPQTFTDRAALEARYTRGEL